MADAIRIVNSAPSRPDTTADILVKILLGKAALSFLSDRLSEARATVNKALVLAKKLDLLDLMFSVKLLYLKIEHAHQVKDAVHEVEKLLSEHTKARTKQRGA